MKNFNWSIFIGFWIGMILMAILINSTFSIGLK